MFDHLSAPALDAEMERRAAEIERLKAEQIQLVAVWNDRQAWALDGALGSVPWLKSHTSMVERDARALVRQASFVALFELVAKALDVGDITSAHVAILATKITGRYVKLMQTDDHEAALVESARMLSVHDFATVVDRWIHLADDVLATEDAADSLELNDVTLSQSLHGRWFMRGSFDSELGQRLHDELKARVDRHRLADSRCGTVGTRTPGQRRAAAFDEMLDEVGRGGGGRSARPVDVVVDLETLDGRPPAWHKAKCETLGGAVHCRSVLDRFMCDASVSRVVMAGASEILDVGHRTPLIPAALRRAVEIRDRYCQFAGCDRDHRWCDVHHLVPRSQGGDTTAINLALACRRHHRMVHEGGWSMVRMADGSIVTRPPP